MRSFLKKTGMMVSVILIALILSFCSFLFLGLQKYDFVMSIIGACLVFVVYSIFIVFIYRFWLNKLKSNDNKNNSLASLMMWLFITILITLVAHYIVSQFVETNQNYVLQPTLYNILYVLVFQVIIASIVEETICRGWFLSLFFTNTNRIYERYQLKSKITNILIGTLTSAFLSTFLHGFTNPVTIILMFLNGVLASMLYYKTQSVKLPIIFHILNNTLAWIALIIN